MNLIIDIGNTRAKLVAFEGDEPKAVLTTDHGLTKMADFIEENRPRRGIVSTTAGLTPEAERRLAELDFPILRMTGLTPTPATLLYRTPQTLGTDRLAAVVGARTLQPEGNILVVDCGTCITYDLLDSADRYLGGNISPGLAMRLRALHEQTARLPLVEAEGEEPEVGFDTATAIRSGVIGGIRHEIEGLIGHFRQKYAPLSVFLTGGDANKLGISKESCIFADDFIVPRGLNRILNYNQ